MKKSLFLAAALASISPAHAEMAIPWDADPKTCPAATERKYAAENKSNDEGGVSKREIDRLNILYDCACDVRFSFEKPHSRCKPEKREHEKQYGKENWR